MPGRMAVFRDRLYRGGFADLPGTLRYTDRCIGKRIESPFGQMAMDHGLEFYHDLAEHQPQLG